MPGTPKSRCVVCKLSEKFQTDCGPISSIKTTFTHGIAVSDEIKNLVKQFYEWDDVSRLAPLNVSFWCGIEYDKELFPWEIKAVVGDKYEVSVMVKAGKYWKWPAPEDKLLHCQNQIVKALNQPVLINSWEHCNFPDFTIRSNCSD